MGATSISRGLKGDSWASVLAGGRKESTAMCCKDTFAAKVAVPALAVALADVSTLAVLLPQAAKTLTMQLASKSLGNTEFVFI
jgi:hypothetical protein